MLSRSTDKNHVILRPAFGRRTPLAFGSTHPSLIRHAQNLCDHKHVMQFVDNIDILEPKFGGIAWPNPTPALAM